MYFYFGGDQLIISLLFVIVSIVFTGAFLTLLAVSFKILVALKKIKEYIKRRGDKWANNIITF